LRALLDASEEFGEVDVLKVFSGTGR